MFCPTEVTVKFLPIMSTYWGREDTIVNPRSASLVHIKLQNGDHIKMLIFCGKLARIVLSFFTRIYSTL